MESINPATGEHIETVPVIDGTELERRLALAATVFFRWRETPFADRSKLMHAAASVLEQDRDTFAATITEEMGKTIVSARAEVEKSASVCRYFADRAREFLGDEETETGARVVCQPLGPVLAVMPWNFPFWQLFRFAAPAVMAGNVALLKHASNVPRSARAIEDVFTRAGFPPGVFQTLLVESGRVNAILDDPRVVAATLTGSTEAGRAVASRAGYNIKKTVLELGGSDPFIVMPSADLDLAVDTAAKARMINNGQSCIAAKRFIIHQKIADRFIPAFVERLTQFRMGDPMDESVQLGPLATEAIRREVAEQVRDSIRAGARLLAGGVVPEGMPGWYYPATVLTDIPRGCPARDDEIFGPVASVFVVSGIDEAISIANETVFGLAASAWTRDEGEKERFARELEAGAVFLNSMVASDPRVPFGGIKTSGYGRELARQGIREFVNIKTVVPG